MHMVIWGYAPQLISIHSYAPVGAVLLGEKVSSGIRDKNGFWKVSEQMSKDNPRLGSCPYLLRIACYCSMATHTRRIPLVAPPRLQFKRRFTPRTC